MKIALCVYGELRTFDHPRLRELWNKNLVEPLNPDVFVSVWDHRGCSNYSRVAGYDTSKAGERISKARVEEIYKPKGIEIHNYDKWFGSISEIRRKSIQSIFVASSICEYFNLQTVIRLKAEQEKITGTYDLVILVRPDLIVFNPLRQIYLDDTESLWHMNTLSAYHPQRVYMPFVMCNSALSDYLALLYDQMEEYWDKPSGDMHPLDSTRICFLHYLRYPKQSLRSFYDRTLFEVLRHERDFNNENMPEDVVMRERQNAVMTQVANNEIPADTEVYRWLVDNKYVRPT